MWKFGFLILAGLMLLGSPDRSIAAEDPVFTLEFEDGKITPLRVEVPARTRFKIELHNKGKSAAEFEMEKPHKEKVLAPGAQSSVVFKTLDPGEYEFIDEFHPEAPKGVIVAR
jgi:uncharacterized cupredoxin-like copper-binding protein